MATSFPFKSSRVVGFLSLLILAFLLYACKASKQIQPTQVAIPATPTAMQTEIRLPMTATSTQSPTPTDTSNKIRHMTPTPEATPMETPVAVITPDAGPEAFHLKTWDLETVLRIYREIAVPNLEPYVDDRQLFYSISLLYETWLDFPASQDNLQLIKEVGQLKGNNRSPYGLIHNHDVEPLRLYIEKSLNNHSATIGRLEYWGENEQIAIEPPNRSNKIFDATTPTAVAKVYAAAGWDYFVIRQNPDGSFAVIALYPEWRQLWWSDETFGITDLNANGRDEITVTWDGWGIGSTHYCDRRISIYEWDGTTFRELTDGLLKVFIPAYEGTCLDTQFLEDANGVKKIQTGIERTTLCEDLPYQEPVVFRWNGQKFVEQPLPAPKPPEADHPDRCLIDWALKAGPTNDWAVKLLYSSLTDWPLEAEKDWGPAARDFFRLKLSAWSFQRGDTAGGLAFLKQIRDFPFAPEYTMATKVATTFLNAYTNQGYYGAGSAVEALYQAELEKANCRFMLGCDTDQLRKSWGFAEWQWSQASTQTNVNDFAAIQSLNMTIDQNPPASLDELLALLKRNQLRPLWSAQGDLDGQGGEDWLVEVEEGRPGNVSINKLYAFIRQGRMVHPVYIVIVRYVSFSNIPPLEPRQWQIAFRDPGLPPENIFQSGDLLYAFRFVQKDGEIGVEVDVDSHSIRNCEMKGGVQVNGWKVEGNRLVVNYNEDESVYAWDSVLGKLIPTGFAPEAQETQVSQAEKALYLDDNPEQAISILIPLLDRKLVGNYETWGCNSDDSAEPRLRPYLQYLLGLAYERSGDKENAVKTYWQLWHDFPGSAYSTAVREKLEK